jgi:lipopolysaccharide export system permease protein
VTINEKVAPWSIDEVDRLRDQIEGQVSQQKHQVLKLPQYASDEVTGMVLADLFTPRTGVLESVKAYEQRNGVPTRVLWAKKAVHKTKNDWKLIGGWYQDVGPNANGSPLVAFAEWDITIQQSAAEIEAEGKKPAEMSMAQLTRKIASLNRDGRGAETQEYEVAWWNRLAMPFASVVFALVGLPLGLRPQRTSGGLGLGLSIVIIFLYWVVWYYTGNLGAKNVLPPFVASWMANFLGIGIGTALLVRAPK